MNYTQPVVYKIDAFDVLNSDTIPNIHIAFTGLGSEIATLTLDNVKIYNNGTGNIISTENGVSISLISYSDDLAIYESNILQTFVNNGYLSNGQEYYITVQITGDSDPVISNGTIFSCYKTPEFDNFNIINNQILQQSSLKITFDYIQINNVTLNWYNCKLYNVNDELVQSSGYLYDENYTYTFNNLVNNTSYYLIVYGATIDNFEFSSAKINFNIQFTQNPDSSLIKLENVAQEGYIKINSNLNNLPGTLNNAELDEGTTDLRNSGSNVIWNQGLEVNDNTITTKLWGKAFNNNTEILKLSDSNESENYIKITTNLGNIGTKTTGNNITVGGTNVDRYIYFMETVNNKHFGAYYDTNNNLYKLVYSSDFINWSVAQSGLGFPVWISTTSDYRYIDYVNGHYYTNGHTNGALRYSSDGENWNNVNLGNIITLSIVYDGTYYWAFGYNGYAYSTNYDFSGATIVTPGGDSYNYYRVAYQNGKFIGINKNFTLSYSLDGINWSNCIDENNNKITLVSYGIVDSSRIFYYKNKYVLYTFDNQNNIITYHSSNGISWEKGENAGKYTIYQSQLLARPIVESDYILSIGANPNNGSKYEIYYSFDGIKWGYLFDTFTHISGVPATEVINNSLYMDSLQANIYTLNYDAVDFNITAKGVDNTNPVTGSLSSVLNNVYFYDWLYIGSQTTLDGLDNNKIDTVSIYAINQHNNPGGV